MSRAEEIKQAMDELFDSVEDFKKRYDDRLNEIEKKQGRPQFGGGDERAAKDNPEHIKAFDRWARKGDISGLLKIYDEAETKGMTAGTDPEGGYLVPHYLSDKITKKIFDQSPMRQLARVETLPEGSEYEEIVDSDDLDAEWVGEVSARNETAAPEIKLANIPVHEMHASPRATQKIIDDSKIDVGRWLVERVSDKFGRTEAAAFISGNGVGKPTGILSYPTSTDSDSSRAWGTLQYVVTGASGDFHTTQIDPLITLTEELRTPYRANACWLMNRASAARARKLKEAGTNRHLWEANVQHGQPPMLLGYPVVIDDNMPDFAANTFPIAFGDFRQGYTIVDRLGIRVLRDPYTAKPHVVFYTTKRVGGACLNSEAIKLLKAST